MSVYGIITDRIVKELERGKIPWQRDWTGAGPKNLMTNHEYRGLNALLLSFLADGFSTPYFATKYQINKLGGKIKKGEKGSLVTFYKLMPCSETVQDSRGETKIVNHQAPFSSVFTCLESRPNHRGSGPKRAP